MLKLVSVQKAKERVFIHFFKNEPIEQFETACVEFVNTTIPSLIRPKAINEIRVLQEKGVEIVIISASPDNWLSPWCKQFGVSLISTRLETNNGKLTGRIEGKNCRGIEKVRRIKMQYKLDEYDEIYAYGDTKGDKPMLGLATIAFYKPFR
jgi:HAD superfamily hydrolase (TIGR01490 family)